MRGRSILLGGALTGALLWAHACTTPPESDTVEPEPVVAEEPAPAVGPEEKEPVAEEPKTEKNNPEPMPQAEPSEPASPPKHVWAPGKEGKLLLGLDGGLYDRYHAATVKEAQLALSEQVLYAGKAHGVLDEETMKAVGEFQLKNGLKVSGVPTPNTRKALLAEQAPSGTT